jgi:hypothetical protein
MRFVGFVYDPETVTARVNVLVCNDLVADNINVSLNLRLLHQEREQGRVKAQHPRASLPLCCYSVVCTNVGL